MTYDEVVGSLHSAPVEAAKQPDRVITPARFAALEGNRQSLSGGYVPECTHRLVDPLDVRVVNADPAKAGCSIAPKCPVVAVASKRP